MKGKASQQLIQFCNEIGFGKDPSMLNRFTITHYLADQIIPIPGRRKHPQHTDEGA